MRFAFVRLLSVSVLAVVSGFARSCFSSFVSGVLSLLLKYLRGMSGNKYNFEHSSGEVQHSGGPYTKLIDVSRPTNICCKNITMHGMLRF